MNKKIIIFGDGEFADISFFCLKRHYNNLISFFSVDDGYLSKNSFNNLDVLPFSEVLKSYKPTEYDFFCAISYKNMNKVREVKFNEIKKNNYDFISYIDERSVIADNAVIGENCLILENQTIQPLVNINDNTFIWSGNHIGHGSKIEKHSYISSHVVISGNCSIGENCFFGVNSSVKDFTKVSNNCFIGMNAAVTTDLTEGSTVIANKNNIYDNAHRFSKIIRKNY
jgi:sugar O-acyltransferase (sialic acid O-acetyltransferase NeuD family)